MSDIDPFELGKELGKIASSIDANTKAVEKNAAETAANTKALQEGKQTFAEIKGELSLIKKTAPCLSGAALPQNCPAISLTQTTILPAPEAEELKADAEKWRWLTKATAWCIKHWSLVLGAIVAVLGVFGEKLAKLAAAFINGGTPPP